MVSQHVDRAWFDLQLSARNLSLRAMARRMGLDPSALSRALNGQRQLKLAEIEQLADLLDQPVAEILRHVRSSKRDAGAPTQGFSEMAQSKFQHDKSETKVAEAKPTPSDHPLFGIWKGKVTLLPDYDYTQPADPDWGKVYED